MVLHAISIWEKCHRRKELSLESTWGGVKGRASGTAVCSLLHPALALLAWGLHSLMYQFLFCSFFWQWNGIYRCRCFTTSLSHPQAELLLTDRIPTTLSRECCLLPAAAAWLIVPYTIRLAWWVSLFWCWWAKFHAVQSPGVLPCAAPWAVLGRSRMRMGRMQEKGRDAYFSSSAAVCQL